MSRELSLLAKTMTYEPGSRECRALIGAKESLLNALQSLKKIKSIDHINAQLKTIYKELDDLHEGRKVLEKEV